MIEVRRDDGELCGLVAQRGDRWLAMTVFGAVLAEVGDEQSARNHVLARGLGSISQRWQLRARCESTWQPVLIQEANPRRVRVALGHYMLPETPTRDISVEELRLGEFELRLKD